MRLVILDNGLPEACQARCWGVGCLCMRKEAPAMQHTEEFLAQLLGLEEMCMQPGWWKSVSELQSLPELHSRRHHDDNNQCTT